MPNPEPRSPNPESRWFGNRRVKPEEKTGLVRGVFASVAARYDLMNDLMSGGLHRLWKDRLVRMMDPKPRQVILDVAGGTGDIALRCAKHVRGEARIIVCDLSPAMLAEGRAKAIDQGWLPKNVASKIDPPSAYAKASADRPAKSKGLLKQTQDFASSPARGEGDEAAPALSWITGNAEDLPLPARSVDVYSIAFGLRNVTHIDKALSEAARVLRPGGRFYCLEFSPGVKQGIKPLYDRYCDEVLPRLGAWVARDRDSYRYLAESIRKFPAQPALARRMETAGLAKINWLNLTGGIAVIHEGRKL